MTKYFNAEKLKTEIKGLQCEQGFEDGMEERGYQFAIKDILSIIDSLQQEQPEVDYNEFEKLFKDFCERIKGHHITSHDACMWFWELGLNARK